jgi:hypothetical protein
VSGFHLVDDVLFFVAFIEVFDIQTLNEECASLLNSPSIIKTHTTYLSKGILKEVIRGVEVAVGAQNSTGFGQKIRIGYSPELWMRSTLDLNTNLNCCITTDTRGFVSEGQQ